MASQGKHASVFINKDPLGFKVKKPGRKDENMPLSSDAVHLPARYCEFERGFKR
jgi:hypothetical protein